jgi:hypothetical protein
MYLFFFFFFDARGCIHYTAQKNSHSAHSTAVAHSRRTPYPDYSSAPHFHTPRHLCLPRGVQLTLHPFKTALPYGIGSLRGGEHPVHQSVGRPQRRAGTPCTRGHLVPCRKPAGSAEAGVGPSLHRRSQSPSRYLGSPPSVLVCATRRPRVARRTATVGHEPMCSRHMTPVGAATTTPPPLPRAPSRNPRTRDTQLGAGRKR